MRTLTPSRLPLVLCLIVPLYAQAPAPVPVVGPQHAPATLPATTPTAAEPAQSTPPDQAAPNRARITYLDHQLTVAAQNSSLNQILHEISQLTGITITGGVAEERVFGSYGPAIPSQVLGQLLDGTASNMLFLSSIGDKPAQLILTPRGGLPTPPNPNAMGFDDNAESNDTPPNPSDSPSESVQSPRQPAATPAAQPGDPASSTDPNQQSPNGTRTPQQIYDQLMKLRQQQQSR